MRNPIWTVKAGDSVSGRLHPTQHDNWLLCPLTRTSRDFSSPGWSNNCIHRACTRRIPFAISYGVDELSTTPCRSVLAANDLDSMSLRQTYTPLSLLPHGVASLNPVRSFDRAISSYLAPNTHNHRFNSANVSLSDVSRGNNRRGRKRQLCFFIYFFQFHNFTTSAKLVLLFFFSFFSSCSS